LGSITPLAGETAASYGTEGMDFPGPGTYFLVVTVTPSCGTPIVSNEIEIDVGSPVAPEPVVAFTALSTATQNYLEWSLPTVGCDSLRILRREDGVFPVDPNDTVSNFWVGGGDFPCSATGKDAFPDSGLANDTKYFYSAFVNDGSSNFSLKRTVTGRPFNNAVGQVKWAFSTGATSMAQTGIRILGGVSSAYVVSNDSRVYALVGGPTGGQWLANAKPYPMGAPSQVRPPVVPFSVGTIPSIAPNGAVFVTSQDGNAYALDADELDPVWTAPVGEQVLGGAAGLFSGFVAGAPNRVFVGTKNTVADNAFRAFDVETGVPSSSFDNSVPQGGTGVPPGMILGGASVDYPTKRAFFGSRYGAGTKSIWAIDVSGATPMLVWSQDIGEIDTSPVLLPGTPRRLVVGTNGAQVYFLDADNGGAPLWPAPYSTGDGNVKAFVFPHAHGPTQYFMFSTVNRVTSILHNGTGTNPTVNWQVLSIPSPSSPLFLPGTLDALVGGGNGRVFRINRVDTTTPTVTFVPLGDGLSAIGAPSFDVVHDLLYVGSDEGVIYAVGYPFP
jgi:outer membrane protein assembly factor BamB